MSKNHAVTTFYEGRKLVEAARQPMTAIVQHGTQNRSSASWDQQMVQAACLGEIRQTDCLLWLCQ